MASGNCKGNVQQSRSQVYVLVTGAIDICTDLLIVSIPFLLLWEVRIPRQRKILIACSLCSSILMVITAIIRVAGARIPNNVVDTIWISFWLGAEGAIAYITILYMTLRALLGKEANQKSTPQKPSSPIINAKLSKHRDLACGGADRFRALPENTRPTGMRKSSSTENTMHDTRESSDLDKEHELDTFNHETPSKEIV